MRRKSSTHSFFLLAALGLVWSANCSKSSDGTFVRLNFTGTVDGSQPIRRIVVNLGFASGTTSSTTFQKPKGDITLNTSAVLDIQHGEGLLTVSASAIAPDGVTVLGTGSGSGTVVRGKTVAIDVPFTHMVTDGGVDTQPGVDGPAPGVDMTIDIPPRETLREGPIDVPSVTETPTFLDTAGPDDAGTDAPITGTGGTGGGGMGGNPGAGGADSLGGMVGSGGSTGTGGTVPDAGPGNYLLTANPPSADFGVILPGNTSPPKTFTIINKGDASAPSLTLTSSDKKTFPVSQDNCAGRTLPPGASCTVIFTFTPGAPGPAQADVGVSPVGAPGAKLQLTGTGAGGPATLSLSPPGVQLPPVDVNTTAPINFVLTNGGDTEAGSIAIRVPADPPGFQLTANGCGSGPLGPRSQCAFTVTFAPPKLGPVATTVSVESSLGLSAKATVSGTGRDTVTLTIGFSGTGKGTVTGGPQPCPSGATCTLLVTRTDPANLPQFTLAAVPNAYNTFSGWSGDCTGTTCTVVMDNNHSVNASFTQQMATLNLTVLSLAGHTGTVSSPDGSVKCSTSNGSCLGLSVPATGAFVLNAAPNAPSTFAAWTGGVCRGVAPQCPFAMTGTVNIVATFGPQAYMFVTSTTRAPQDLGGIEGADKLCTMLAEKAGLPLGTYMAWLSSSKVAAQERVGRGGWIRTDGRPFAHDLNSLVDPGYYAVLYPPRVDENGRDLAKDLGYVHFPVATGSGPDGKPAGSAGQCGDYSTEGPLVMGDAASGSAKWSSNGEDAQGCTSPRRYYCFRTDVTAPGLVPAKQTGRRVFTTSVPYLLKGGVKPNEFCMQDAKAASLPGTFVAFIAYNGASAMSGIDLKGLPWQRLDGVFIVEQPSDLGQMRLLAPIDALPNGANYTTASVWTGAAEPRAGGTDTCGDWATPGSIRIYGIVGDSSTTAAPDWFDLPPAAACPSEVVRLTCLDP
jgi:hypothetical protein